MERRRFGATGLLLVVLVVVFVGYLAGNMRRAGDISYSQLRSLFTEEKVQSFAIENERLTASLRDGTTATCELYSFETFYEDLNDLVVEQNKAGIIEAYDYHADHSTNWVQVLLPYVLAIMGFILLLNLMNRMNGGGAAANDKMARFGEARTQSLPTGSKKVTFQDVAGADEEKEELREIVEFLKNPKKYIDLGARIPKGVLLLGPPGTGKTLLARAVAGEAGCPFFPISGSDFVEMFVGVGASRVRDLFEQAKKHSPSIIFIDEIDAVGRHRGAGLGGGHDEREQTLNQLLTEMDGFDGRKGVVILAATNRPETLDKALLRPGRFDRRIPVELPDLKGREAILKVHAENVKMEGGIDFGTIARATSGASGAELANIINEAALRAVRMGHNRVKQEDLMESVEVILAGYQRKGAVISPEEKKIIAYHEVGHALVAAKQKNSAPVQKITIIPRTSGALGYTLQVDEGEKSLMSKEELFNKIATFTGGRVAEELKFGSVTTGASNDIEQATRLARGMITRYGMSEEFGMVALETINNQYLGGDTSLACSNETATKIDAAVVAVVKQAHEKAVGIIRENMNKLDEIAQFLLEKETITGEEFMEILNRTEE